MNTKFIVILILASFLCSCGAPNSTGVAVFKTSTVSAALDTVALDVDVTTWVDSSNAKVSSCTASGAIATIPASNDVKMTVSATGFEKVSTGRDTTTGGVAVQTKPILVENVTIKYDPANTAAVANPLTTQYQAIGQLINISQSADPPSGSLVIPIRVVSTDIKRSLQTLLACNPTAAILSYYVTIAVNVTEVGTDTKNTIETKMQIWLSDFIDP